LVDGYLVFSFDITGNPSSGNDVATISSFDRSSKVKAELAVSVGFTPFARVPHHNVHKILMMALEAAKMRTYASFFLKNQNGQFLIQRQARNRLSPLPPPGLPWGRRN
jgi:hypothetical protein